MTIPNTLAMSPTMNFGLGETADQLRDMVKAFSASEIGWSTRT